MNDERLMYLSPSVPINAEDLERMEFLKTQGWGWQWIQTDTPYQTWLWRFRPKAIFTQARTHIQDTAGQILCDDTEVKHLTMKLEDDPKRRTR